MYQNLGPEAKNQKAETVKMEENDKQEPNDDLSPMILKRALKAFKKRLKLTSLDEDSRLGRGPLSGGSTGTCAIQPPNQFPLAVWEELCKQGRLHNTGQGLYKLQKPTK